MKESGIPGCAILQLVEWYAQLLRWMKPLPQKEHLNGGATFPQPADVVRKCLKKSFFSVKFAWQQLQQYFPPTQTRSETTHRQDNEVDGTHTDFHAANVIYDFSQRNELA